MISDLLSSVIRIFSNETLPNLQKEGWDNVFQTDVNFNEKLVSWNEFSSLQDIDCWTRFKGQISFMRRKRNISQKRMRNFKTMFLMFVL